MAETALANIESADGTYDTASDSDILLFLTMNAYKEEKKKEETDKAEAETTVKVVKTAEEKMAEKKAKKEENKKARKQNRDLMKKLATSTELTGD